MVAETKREPKTCGNGMLGGEEVECRESVKRIW